MRTRIVFTSMIAAACVLLVSSTALAQRGPGAGRGPMAGPPAATEDIPSAKSLAADDVEQKILDVIADLDANQRRGNMNVPLKDGRLIRLLTESTGAKNVVEIGTSNGFSGLWFCLALRKTGGHLTTHDIDEGRIKLARENFAKAGVTDMITIVQGDAHEEIKNLKGPIDIVFIDADKPGYPDYLEKLLPLVKPGGLILGHNMRRPAPDPTYIEMITTNPQLETIFMNMDESGIAVSMKKR